MIPFQKKFVAPDNSNNVMSGLINVRLNGRLREHRYTWGKVPWVLVFGTSMRWEGGFDTTLLNPTQSSMAESLCSSPGRTMSDLLIGTIITRGTHQTTNAIEGRMSRTVETMSITGAENLQGPWHSPIEVASLCSWIFLIYNLSAQGCDALYSGGAGSQWANPQLRSIHNREEPAYITQDRCVLPHAKNSSSDPFAS